MLAAESQRMEEMAGGREAGGPGAGKPEAVPQLSQLLTR